MSAKFKSYLYRYFHEGTWWQFEIQAASAEDAQARVNKLPLAQYLGVVAMKMPARVGVVPRLLCWMLNLMSGKK